MNLYKFEEVEIKNQHHFNSFIIAIDNSSFHWHYEYEIIVILKGSVVVYTKHKSVLLKENDIFLINTKTLHSIKQTDEENMCMVIQLNPILFQKDSDKDVTYNFHLNSADQTVPINVEYQQFIKTVARLTLLSLENDRHNDYRIRALIFQFIADLFDYVIYETNYQIKIVSDDSINLMEIIEYIDSHLSDENIQESLCTALGYSQRTLNRYLNDNIGLSIKKLIDNMRIDKAKHLLKHTEKSIDYIADTSGFHSESTFYRIFKHNVGITPTKYREKDVPLEKSSDIQGYLEVRHKEAIQLLSKILEEDNDEIR